MYKNKYNPRKYLNRKNMQKYEKINEMKNNEILNNSLYLTNDFEKCIVFQLDKQMENLRREYWEFSRYKY